MAKQYFNISKFGGFITEVSPEDLKEGFAQKSENVLTDNKIGALIQRRGSTTYHHWDPSAEGGVKGPITTIYPDEERILMTLRGVDESYLWDSKYWGYINMNESGDFANILPSTKHIMKKEKFRCAIQNDVVYVASGIYPLCFWQKDKPYSAGPPPRVGELRIVGGDPYTNVEYTYYNVPWAKYIAVHGETLFLANGSACPDTVYFSALTGLQNEGFVAPKEAGAWQGSLTKTLGNGEDITGIISYSNLLVITQKSHIWVARGAFPHYYWEEVKLDSGEPTGCFEDSLAIRDGILYGMDERRIWAFDGSSLKDLTTATIKTKYQDRDLFPIINTGSLYLHQQQDYGTIATDRNEGVYWGLDLEAEPGVIQLVNFQNMRMKESGDWENPANAIDGNPLTYAVAKPGFNIDFYPEDIYGKNYTVKILSVMMDIRASGNVLFRAADGESITLDTGNVRKIKKFNFNTIQEASHFWVEVPLGTSCTIWNMWIPGGIDSTYTSSNAGESFKCSGVKDWGHFEADIKLTNNIGAIITEEEMKKYGGTKYSSLGNPNDVDDNGNHSIKIEFKNVGGGWHELRRGETISTLDLGSGDVELDWRIRMMDTQIESGEISDYDDIVGYYPNYPKFYALRLNWLKTNNDWELLPIAQSWNGKVIFDFPKKEGTSDWLVLDKENNWHMYNVGASISSMGVFNNKLIGGRTINCDDGNAEVVELDTGGLDSDYDGGKLIKWKWQSKEFRLDDSRKQMELKRYDIIIKNDFSLTNLLVSYVVDGKIYSKTIPIEAEKEKTYGFWFPAGLQGHRFYFEISGIGKLEIKQIIVEVNIKPLKI